MLEIFHRTRGHNCAGMTRRTALKVGSCAALGLTLPALLQSQASGAPVRREKSVILLWLDGGPSQLESYDPKPDAPAEYRGPWSAIPTNVPGIHISDILPLHAKHADKFALIRSLHHDNGDHFAAGHWMLTGRFGATSANKEPQFPSIGSSIAKVRGPLRDGLPTYIGLPSAHAIYIYPGYMGSAYLGSAYNPFDVQTQQRYLSAKHQGPIQPPNFLGSIDTAAQERTSERMTLLGRLDQLERRVDQSGMMNSLDQFQAQAAELILSGKARAAFDIEQEDAATRDKYGRGPWGHYTLLARRLVEAGAGFITVDMPHWDDHSSIEAGHGYKLPYVDRAVSALLEDLSDRGLLNDTIVVVMGEFGRTPRINTGQPGIPVPGRDHWGNAISVLIAGGGVVGGQVVGQTNDKAEHPIDRALKPADLLATIYHLLGIDYTRTFLNFAGRPIPILDQGEPIRELL